MCKYRLCREIWEMAKKSLNNTFYGVGQTMKLRPHNSLEVGNASTTGKLMRSFVTVPDTIPPLCLIQKAKAFYNER